MNYRPAICVDFDGTICTWAFPSCGDPTVGVKLALELFRAAGYEIIIWSCRTAACFRQSPLYNKYIDEMISFLSEHEIPYDRIDMGNEGKPVADFYIDDRAITFTNWMDVVKQFHKMPDYRWDGS